MIILGIDPGSRITGYGVIKSVNQQQQYLASGCIKIADQDWPGKLHTIYTDLTNIITRYQPQQISIEKIFVHKNASSALKLGQARGVSIVTAANLGIPVYEYAARAIKQAITGSGGADKKQMQTMVKTLLNLNKAPSQDAADALAIAMCHGLHARSAFGNMLMD
jgi:crossover junction endodeoxyribonuclease RuvC